MEFNLNWILIGIGYYGLPSQPSINWWSGGNNASHRLRSVRCYISFHCEFSSISAVHCCHYGHTTNEAAATNENIVQLLHYYGNFMAHYLWCLYQWDTIYIGGDCSMIRLIENMAAFSAGIVPVAIFL